MVFEWKDEYNTGVSIVDLQHQEMFSLMGDLDDAISSDKPLEVLDGILSSLIDSTNKHFVFEEEHFKKFNYEFSGEHESQHKIFLVRLNSLREKIEGHHEDLQDHLADLLEHWLSDHINNHDRKFVELFHKNGL